MDENDRIAAAGKTDTKPFMGRKTSGEKGANPSRQINEQRFP